MARKEGPLVELLPPEPAGDFVVALAGVAGGAGRHDVFEAYSATDWPTVLVIEPGRLGQSQLRRATGRCVVRGPLTGHCQRVQKSSG